MHLRTIHLTVPAKVVQEFKQQSKRAFPKETFAYLLGRDAGTIVEVEELFVPLDVEERCSKFGVEIGADWIADARKEASAHGLRVVGDIHSHPFVRLETLKPGCAPSECDIDHGMTQIHGICQVRKCKTGKLIANVRFWGPCIPVIAEIS